MGKKGPVSGGNRQRGVLAQPTTILVGFRRHVKWLLAFALGQERGRIRR